MSYSVSRVSRVAACVLACSAVWFLVACFAFPDSSAARVCSPPLCPASHAITWACASFCVLVGSAALLAIYPHKKLVMFKFAALAYTLSISVLLWGMMLFYSSDRAFDEETQHPLALGTEIALWASLSVLFVPFAAVPLYISIVVFALAVFRYVHPSLYANSGQ